MASLGEHVEELAEEEAFLGSCSESEELLSTSRRSSSKDESGTKVRKRRTALFNAVGLVLGQLLVLVCLACGVKHFSQRGADPLHEGHALPAARPGSARALLESDALANVATDNLMAMSQGSLDVLGRDAVRTHVGRRLQNISENLREQDPKAHEALNSLQLSKEQQDATLHVLTKYSDQRLLSLASDLAAAARETVEEDGDSQQFRRRLSAKLGPRLGELKQLAEDMFAGKGDSFQLNEGSFDKLESVQHFDQWAKEDAIPMRTTRRLDADQAYIHNTEEDVDGGVAAQVQTLYRVLEGHFGDRMPQAPARMLSMSSMFGEHHHAGHGSTHGGHNKKPSFMECVMKAVPNPMGVAECIATNVKEVMEMMMQFFQQHAR